ncbi:MAG: ExeA family protein [Verrucomicrobiota bacterium]
MYTEFYNFIEPPFNITPDPRYLYLSQQHQEAFNHLLFGIRERKGFIQLTGEVGCGKTTLCRALFDELGNEVNTAVVLNPVLSETQLLKTILRELGVTKTARDRLGNYEILNEYLLENLRRERDTLLVIDEAQDLPATLLEFVRLLSNLETDNQKLIQILLVGQPELRDVLNDPSLRQLRQRITVRFHLDPLSEADTHRYVSHRVAVAGSRGVPVFRKRALRRIHRYSRGIPRLINALADKCLLAGYVYRSEIITASMVRKAEKELEGHIK